MFARTAMAAAAAFMAMAFSGPAFQQASAGTDTCAAEWQAAKESGRVAPGEIWPTFLADCRARHAGELAAGTPATTAFTDEPVVLAQATTKPAPAPAATAPAQQGTTTTPAAPPATGGRAAMVSREKQCGARWKQIKGTSALPAGVTTWPKYWSWCNKQLKAGHPI